MLGIYIKDFEQNLIGSVYADQDQIFESIIFKYFKDDSIKMIKYIDIYYDTTLNHLMVKDLIIDIDHLLQRASGKEYDVLLIIRHMCDDVLKEDHQYLIFDGD